MLEESGLPGVGDGHVDERDQVVHHEEEQVIPAVTRLYSWERKVFKKENKERERERERLMKVIFFGEREREYLPMVDMGIKCDRERQILSVQEVVTHFM